MSLTFLIKTDGAGMTEFKNYIVILLMMVVIKMVVAVIRIIVELSIALCVFADEIT